MPKRARRSKRSTRTSRNDRPPPDDVEKRSTTLPRVLRYSPLDMPSTEDKGPLWGLASLEPGAGLSPASLVHPPTTPTPKGGRRPPLRRAGPRPTSRRCGARSRRSPRSVPRVPSKALRGGGQGNPPTLFWARFLGCSITYTRGALLELWFWDGFWSTFTAGCGGIDPCTPGICERLKTPSEEG
jgi:hypothetical protein